MSQTWAPGPLPEGCCSDLVLDQGHVLHTTGGSFGSVATEQKVSRKGVCGTVGGSTGHGHCAITIDGMWSWGQGSSRSTHRPPCPHLPRPPRAPSKCPQEERLCPQGPGLQDTGVNLCDTTWPPWPWPLPGRHPLLAAVEPGLGHRKGLYPPWSSLAVVSENSTEQEEATGCCVGSSV